MNKPVPPGDTTQTMVTELIRDHGTALGRYAYVLTGDAQEAEDVLQAVLSRLLERELGQIQNLAAFATRSVTNEFLTRKRRRRRQLTLERTLIAASPVPASDMGSTLAERDLLRWALEPLSPRQRAAVTLRYLNECNDQEIAEQLGCATGTVRSLISRALPILRNRLSSWEHSDAHR